MCCVWFYYVMVTKQTRLFVSFPQKKGLEIEEKEISAISTQFPIGTIVK